MQKVKCFIIGLSESFIGEFNGSDVELQNIRKEILDINVIPGFKDDRQNLKNDVVAISSDLKKAFDEKTK
jgi:hypothetical protein